jgi:K+-transporting ATPase ATPase C chain
MKKDLLTGFIAILVMTVFLGIVYPLVVTGISQVVFPGKANGSKVSVDGKVVGSSLIAQSFSRPVIGKNGKPVLDEEGEEVLAPDPAYFQPRPSATGYSADVTFFGNAGPNSKEARDEVRANLAAYLKREAPYDAELQIDGPGIRLYGGKAAHQPVVPVDAVTQSASGVDPHISVANARIQAHRVAAVRGVPLAQVEDLIAANTDGRFLGLLGEPGVNVLMLNIALDKEAPLK